MCLRSHMEIIKQNLCNWENVSHVKCNHWFCKKKKYFSLIVWVCDDWRRVGCILFFIKLNFIFPVSSFRKDISTSARIITLCNIWSEEKTMMLYTYSLLYIKHRKNKKSWFISRKEIHTSICLASSFFVVFNFTANWLYCYAVR